VEELPVKPKEISPLLRW